MIFPRLNHCLKVELHGNFDANFFLKNASRFHYPNLIGLGKHHWHARIYDLTHAGECFGSTFTVITIVLFSLSKPELSVWYTIIEFHGISCVLCTNLLCCEPTFEHKLCTTNCCLFIVHNITLNFTSRQFPKRKPQLACITLT